MIELPVDCENTIGHLLFHLKSANEALKISNIEQFRQDLFMANDIASNLVELENE